ncbi:MAG TPA: MBL fold metallo-hydrolase [Solirubrobacter sp.]|nr:MBL fold metallo-hydrolase [Solirubrobacter sp.]
MRRITWLGHATVLIEADGARLLTDPVLRDRVAHLRRRVRPAREPGRLDGVLVSHVHYDHLDRPSLRRVAARDVAAVVPAGAARLLGRLPFGTVHEVRAGDAVDVAGVRVEAVQAWHDGRRRPGSEAFETLGFVADGVWFAGDTGLDDGMAALRGAVDVALVPIWGWGPSLGPGHLDPRTAAQAVALVQPRVAVPIHWGTFLPIGARRRHSALLTEPPERFAAHVAELAPATRVETVAPGGTVEL